MPGELQNSITDFARHFNRRAFVPSPADAAPGYGGGVRFVVYWDQNFAPTKSARYPTGGKKGIYG